MKGFLKLFVIFFIIFTVTMGGAYALVFKHLISENNLHKDNQTNIRDIKLKGETPKDESALTKRINILLMGVDSLNDKNDQSRTDTLMLFSYNPENNTSFILSIPRDSLVKMGDKEDKINHAHVFGGKELTISTVENLLDIKVDHYIKADYQALFKTVDDVGGVEIDVPINMKYSDPYATPPLYINLNKGLQVLDGQKAMQYLRFRKGYSNQDIGRAHAQQEFVQQLAKKVLSPSSIKNVPKYIQTVSEYTSTDLNLSDMILLSKDFINIKPSEIEKAVLEGTPISISGGSYYKIDDQKKEDLMKYLLNGDYTKKEEAPQQIKEMDNKEKEEKKEELLETEKEKKIAEEESIQKIAIVNGSGTSGLAIRASDLIRISGLEILGTGNADSFDYEQTIIYHKKDMLEDARLIKKALGTGKILEEQKTFKNKKVDILVVIGQDFK